MLTKINLKNCRFLFTLLVLFGSLSFINAQSAKPTPTPNEEKWGDFDVKSSIELGVRGKSIDGSDNKYRSDLNYKSGFRVFNSSFSLEDKDGKNKVFDSLLINTSGWGADPSGYVRFNLEKSGGYRLTSNIRRVTYFNNLNNHSLGEHTQNTQNNLGDFDLTVFPESDKLRLNFGYSYSRYTGPGFWTARNYRDDFATPMVNDVKSNDFRAGIQAKVLGFNLSFTQGYRLLNDKTKYVMTTPNVGNNTTDTTIYNSFSRLMPTRGESFYSIFDFNRTVAKKLDFTGRIVYSSTQTRSQVVDAYTGRDNSNNFVDLDAYNIFALGKRPQTRGDLGVSYRVTDDFTLSNTFSFDQFNVNGGEDYYQSFALRNSAGVTQTTRITTSTAYRVNGFKRYTNLLEGDYQFANWVGVHLGYKYTQRKVNISGYDLSILSSNNPATVNNAARACPYTGTGSANPLIFCENEENSTNAFIGGMKIKPVKGWNIFWDVEKGEADNVFSRVENYNFTNFRVRNRVTLNRFALNFSVITKDNTNPTRDTLTSIGFGPVVKSRIFSGSADWNLIPELTFSSGYTYTHQTSKTPIYIIGASSARVLGRSEFYVRDHYAFFDVVANPVKRVSIYASYRISKDTGQGNTPLTNPYALLISNASTTLANPQDIIFSYPFQLQSPEVRASIRLTNHIDWNIGYQYFGYKEKFQTIQDYRAHLPYTSLTIYFGGADR